METKLSAKMINKIFIEILFYKDKVSFNYMFIHKNGMLWRNIIKASKSRLNMFLMLHLSLMFVNLYCLYLIGSIQLQEIWRLFGAFFIVWEWLHLHDKNLPLRDFECFCYR